MTPNSVFTAIPWPDIQKWEGRLASEIGAFAEGSNLKYQAAFPNIWAGFTRLHHGNVRHQKLRPWCANKEKKKKNGGGRLGKRIPSGILHARKQNQTASTHWSLLILPSAPNGLLCKISPAPARHKTSRGFKTPLGLANVDPLTTLSARVNQNCFSWSLSRHFQPHLPLLLCKKKNPLGAAIWAEAISRLTLLRPGRESVVTRGGAKEAPGKASPKLPDDLFPLHIKTPPGLITESQNPLGWKRPPRSGPTFNFHEVLVYGGT